MSVGFNRIGFNVVPSNIGSASAQGFSVPRSNDLEGRHSENITFVRSMRDTSSLKDRPSSSDKRALLVLLVHLLDVYQHTPGVSQEIINRLIIRINNLVLG